MPFVSEGSEDELEISTQLSGDENSMEAAMVPPQNENGLPLGLEMSPSSRLFNTTSDHINNNRDELDLINPTTPINFNSSLDSSMGSPKLSIKSADQLMYSPESCSNHNQEKAGCDFLNEANKLLVVGKYLNGLGRFGPQVLLGSNAMPPELEMRDGGVFAKAPVPKGARYGPFQGKWAGVPHDPRFAWEVSQKIPSYVN